MKYIIAFILGLVTYPILPDVAELVDSKYDTEYWVTVGVPSYGLALGLTGRCTNYVRENKITNRQYFGCGKLNIMISDKLYGAK